MLIDCRRELVLLTLGRFSDFELDLDSGVAGPNIFEIPLETGGLLSPLEDLSALSEDESFDDEVFSSLVDDLLDLECRGSDSLVDLLSSLVI